MKAGVLAAYDSLSSSPEGVMARDMGQLLRGGDVRWRTPDRAEIAALTPEAFRATWEPLLKSGPLEVQIYGDIGAEQAIALVGKTRSEEHTSELQSLMRISYAVFCLK